MEQAGSSLSPTCIAHPRQSPHLKSHTIAQVPTSRHATPPNTTTLKPHPHHALQGGGRSTALATQRIKLGESSSERADVINRGRIRRRTGHCRPSTSTSRLSPMTARHLTDSPGRALPGVFGAWCCPALAQNVAQAERASASADLRVPTPSPFVRSMNLRS